MCSALGFSLSGGQCRAVLCVPLNARGAVVKGALRQTRLIRAQGSLSLSFHQGRWIRSHWLGRCWHYDTSAGRCESLRRPNMRTNTSNGAEIKSKYMDDLQGLINVESFILSHFVLPISIPSWLLTDTELKHVWEEHIKSPDCVMEN